MENQSRHVFALVLVLSVAAVMLAFNAGITLANTDNITINVTVAAVTEITVSPHNLTWDAIIPGSIGGFRNVTVQNTGSNNASNLYAFVTTLTNESVYPYTGSAANLYASGGVLVFKNESTVSNMSWAGRLEWNWSSQISNTNLGAITPPSRRSEGFVRNATKQFYWAVGNGTNGTAGSGSCNDTGTIFAIESDEDNGTSITRTPVSVGAADAQDAEWSYFSINIAGHFLQGQCVAVFHNCTKIYIYDYDKRVLTGLNFNACSNSNYIRANTMVPTATEKIQADIWMPKGVPAGAMAMTWWTFVVS